MLYKGLTFFHRGLLKVKYTISALKDQKKVWEMTRDCTQISFFCTQEAIEVFKEALKLKSDFIDAYKSLGQAYRWDTTDDHMMIMFMDGAHVCGCVFRELGDFENAMDSFQKALLLDQNHIQSLQLRGMMLYHHGSLQEAIGNFKVNHLCLLKMIFIHFYDLHANHINAICFLQVLYPNFSGQHCMLEFGVMCAGLFQWFLI